MVHQQLTTAEVAARWGVHVETVRRYQRSGKLKSSALQNVGRSIGYVYSIDHIRAFEAEFHITPISGSR